MGGRSYVCSSAASLGLFVDGLCLCTLAGAVAMAAAAIMVAFTIGTEDIVAISPEISLTIAGVAGAIHAVGAVFRVGFGSPLLLGLSDDNSLLHQASV